MARFAQPEFDSLYLLSQVKWLQLDREYLPKPPTYNLEVNCLGQPTTEQSVECSRISYQRSTFLMRANQQGCFNLSNITQNQIYLY